MKSNLTRFRITVAMAMVLCLTIMVHTTTAATVTNELTVTNVIETDSVLSDTVTLAAVTAGTGGEETVYKVRWRLEQSGWFPSWYLELVSDRDLLPTATASADKLANDNASYLVLDQNSPPRAGHVYETQLAVHGSKGWLAVKIRDVTNDQIVFADGFTAQPYVGTLQAPPHHTVEPKFIPVATVWQPGIRYDTGGFVAMHKFPTRQVNEDEQAAVRLVTPNASGQYRLMLETGQDERLLAEVEPAGRETWIPLTLTEFPLGPSALRVDYVVDGQIQMAAKQSIGIGSVEISMADAPVRSHDMVTASAVVRSAEPFSTPLSAVIWADLYRLVWDKTERNFNNVLQNRVMVYDGPVDLSTGQTEIALQWPLPEHAANWQVVLGASFEPAISHTSMSRKDILFSGYSPAVINEGEPYTIAILPDTQYYAGMYPWIYTRLTDWLTSVAEEMNIAAILHVGDITDNNIPVQWERSYASMSLLHGVIPYALTLGNHDVTPEDYGQVTERGLSRIDNYFSAAESRLYNGLVDTFASDKLENHYHLFSIGGDDYVVVALEFGPPDEAVAWAGEIAENYPDHRFILLTHSYSSTTGGLSRSAANYEFAGNPNTTVNTGEELWRKLIQQQPNAFMVISGHLSVSGATVPYRVARTVHDNPVFELLVNWQYHDDGGNGWLGLLTFNPDNTVDVNVYSPYLDRYSNDVNDHGFSGRYRLHLDDGTVTELNQ